MVRGFANALSAGVPLQQVHLLRCPATGLTITGGVPFWGLRAHRMTSHGRVPLLGDGRWCGWPWMRA